MSDRMKAAILLMVCWSCSARAEVCAVELDDANSSERLPVPNEADQQAAMTLIKSVFEEEFATAKDVRAKSDLARKILEVASKTEDQTERFVLLRVGQDMAALRP